MAIKLDVSFNRAMNLLNKTLKQQGIHIGFSNLEDFVCKDAIILSSEVANMGRGEDLNDSVLSAANVTVAIRYSIMHCGSKGVQTVTKSSTLNMLSTAGDIGWCDKMNYMVFDNDPPSAVCVDNDSFDVYFMYLRPNRIDLQYINTIAKEDRNTFLTINKESPYSVHLSEPAMFDYIAGKEGTNHLRRNVYVKFHCAHPLYLPQLPHKIELEDSGTLE